MEETATSTGNQPRRPAIIRKVWGHENVLVSEPEYTLKELHVYAGKRCSLHYHQLKKETFLVQSGLVRLERPGLNLDELLKSGEQRTIMPMTPHRFSSVHGAVILEVSTFHDDADVFRLEPSGDAKN